MFFDSQATFTPKVAAFVLPFLATFGCSRARPPGLDPMWVEPATGMELVLLDGGRFTMGTPSSEPGREPQERLHPVRLSRPFYMGRTEVTQAQWEAVMGDNPSHFGDCGPDCPVESVSFLAIQRFLDRLAAHGGERLRLPTEAEWEYACRAGSATAFAWGETLQPDQASFDGSDPYPGATPGPAPPSPSPVGSFAPNAWGLFDMHGNVWEWALDRHCPYADDAVDPLADCRTEMLVIRGGSWSYGADSARCGLRHVHRPQDDGPGLGFRLVREIRPGGSRTPA